MIESAQQVMTSFAGTPAYEQLLRQSVEKLVQHVLVQRDMIRDLRSQQTDTRELDNLRDQLSYTQARILELEELLRDSQDQIRRLVDGCATDWEVEK